MMAELMGRETGYVVSRRLDALSAEVERQNNLGSTGIVGGNQPPAVSRPGREVQEVRQGRPVVLRRRATNTDFHESMNMASTPKSCSW